MLNRTEPHTYCTSTLCTWLEILGHKQHIAKRNRWCRKSDVYTTGWHVAANLKHDKNMGFQIEIYGFSVITCLCSDAMQYCCRPRLIHRFIVGISGADESVHAPHRPLDHDMCRRRGVRRRRSRRMSISMSSSNWLRSRSRSSSRSRNRSRRRSMNRIESRSGSRRRSGLRSRSSSRSSSGTATNRDRKRQTEIARDINIAVNFSKWQQMTTNRSSWQ